MSKRLSIARVVVQSFLALRRTGADLRDRETFAELAKTIGLKPE